MCKLNILNYNNYIYISIYNYYNTNTLTNMTIRCLLDQVPDIMNEQTITTRVIDSITIVRVVIMNFNLPANELSPSDVSMRYIK